GGLRRVAAVGDERRGRRAVGIRHPPHRHAGDAGAGVAGHPAGTRLRPVGGRVETGDNGAPRPAATREDHAMRAKPLLLTVALATATMAAGPALAQAGAAQIGAAQIGAAQIGAAQIGAAQIGAATTAPPPVAPPAVIPPADAATALPAAAAPGDEVVRSVYIMTGAMAGYMFAVMPVTMSAVTAAMISGAASMWAYDYVLGPA